MKTMNCLLCKTARAEFSADVDIDRRLTWLCGLCFSRVRTNQFRSKSAEEIEKDHSKVVRGLEQELLKCQKQVIELQKKVIDLQEEGLSAAKAVTDTVKREMKSFSTVISTNCAAAIAPSKLKNVLKKSVAPITDEVDRSCNLMIFNLEEEKGSADTAATAKEDCEAVERILEELNEKMKLTDVKRVGVKSENKTRPMIATLSSRENLLTLLKKAKDLRQTDNFHNVYIGPDRTFEERESRRKTLESLKRLRGENSDKQYVLRKGLIECL